MLEYVSHYMCYSVEWGGTDERAFSEADCAELAQCGIAHGATLPLRRWQALELVNKWNRASVQRWSDVFYFIK